MNIKRNYLWGMIAVLAVIAGLAAYLVLVYQRSGQKQTRVDIRTLPPQEQQKKVAELIKSEDITKCDEAKGLAIAGVDYYTACRNNISSNLALKNLDISQCANLDDKAFSISDCQKTVLAAKLAGKIDISVCDQSPPELKVACQDDYWVRAAVKDQDIKLCEHLSNEVGKTNCRDNYLLESLRAEPKKIATFKCSDFSPFLREHCDYLKSELAKPSAAPPVCSSVDVRFGDICWSFLSNEMKQ